MRIGVLMVITSVVSGLGCAHVISKDALKEVNRDIPFAQLLKDPMSYQGQMVLLGGVIVRTTYDQAGTLLEIYQTEMDWEEKPVNIDVSEGRFLALYKGFLDSEIYKEGRKVTIAGVVTGVRTSKLGEIDYHYPSLLIREIHLWKKEIKETCDPYLWYPWGMWGTWYYPYWRY
ncbi:MAG: Slp family lipoprotein [Candidatus Desulfacyla sp.]